jgi:hypothetical protein
MKRPKIKDIVSLTVKLLVLLGIGLLVYFFFFNKKKSDELQLDETPLKVEQIRSILELNTVKFEDEVVVDSVEYYRDFSEAFSGTMDKLFDVDQLKNGFSNDGVKRRLTFIVKGHLLFGVDLKRKDFLMRTKNDTLFLTLPQPELLSIAVNPSDVEVYIENGKWADHEKLKLITATSLMLVEKAKQPIEKLLTKLNVSNKTIIIQYN